MVDNDGYVNLWDPSHPCAKKSGYVLEHRAVACKMLGRTLRPGEVVHHRNADKADNRPENLEVFATNAEHLRAELSGRCPNWTPEGRERTLDGVRRWHATRQGSGRGGPPSP